MEKISQKTKELIERYDKATLAAPDIWNEEKIIACINQMYELYGLKKIKNIEKKNDPFDKIFLETSRASWVSRASWSSGASWASGASRVSRASRASGASWASGASVNYDGREFIFTHEFLENNKGNKDDDVFLKCGFLWLEALENGLGYFTEYKGIGYIAPHPKVLLNEQNQYHSEKLPAISWKEGAKSYFLQNILLKKELWESIINKTLPAKDALMLENQDQRTVAMHYLGGEKILKELGGKPFVRDEYGELWKLEEKDTNGN